MFFLFVAFCPLFLLALAPLGLMVIWLTVVLLIADWVVLALVIYKVDSEELSLFCGLNYLTRPYMSGCANITILYIFFVLAGYYTHAIAIVISELKQDRSRAADKWAKFVFEELTRSINQEYYNNQRYSADPDELPDTHINPPSEAWICSRCGQWNLGSMKECRQCHKKRE